MIVDLVDDFIAGFIFQLSYGESDLKGSVELGIFFKYPEDEKGFVAVEGDGGRKII